MKSVIGAAVIVAALAPWQLNAHATMVTTRLEGQPLTRVACDTAGLVWTKSRNVCDWQPTRELGSDKPPEPLLQASRLPEPLVTRPGSRGMTTETSATGNPRKSLLQS
jgi:hypothetical protein